MTRNDQHLIEACLAGDGGAWRALVDRYGRLVYSVPRRYGLCDADCEDVHQAVFLNLYRALSGLRDQSRLSSWLITAAHRESWRIGRRSERYADLSNQIPDVATPSDELVETLERQQAIREALADLGGRCAELLTALFLDRSEPSYEEIAERLGMSVGSIGPTRARCFGKLEAILRRSGFLNDAGP